MARACTADRGAVTVEAAIALSAFMTVVVMVFAGVSAAIDQIRCTDASREAARLVARGEAAGATDAVARIGPGGATLTVHQHGEQIIAEVDADGIAEILPGIDIGAQAYAIAEPTVAAGGPDEPSAIGGPPAEAPG
jgi:hypothetical protein